MKGKSKSESNSSRILMGTLVALIIIAGVMWYRASQAQKPQPGGKDIYYTGPMESKGKPGVWGVDGGQRVAPPPGAATSSEKAAPTTTKASGVAAGG